MTLKILRAILILVFVFSFSVQSFAMTASESINNFAFNAAKILASDNEGKNFFFSPYSIMTAFSMAYAGAKNETAKEIEKVLGLNKELHKDFKEIFRGIEGGSLLSANRVWLREGLTLKKEYSRTLVTYYGGKAKELDFENKTEESRNIINDWVSSKTNGKIQNLLQSLEPETQMILTNAVYFNAEWEAKFNKDRTKDKDFYIDGENSVKVPMMTMRRDFDYAEDNGTKIIRLPYDNERFSMIAVLPPKDVSFEDALKDFDYEKFHKLLTSMTEYEVDLWLPKFKTENHYELKKLFEALGVNLAFSNFADFSGITDDTKLKIDEVIHQTFIDVNEERTEAAAATAIRMMKVTAMRPIEKPRAEFHADRPFIYFIYDERSGTILFMGRQTFAK